MENNKDNENNILSKVSQDFQVINNDTGKTGFSVKEGDSENIAPSLAKNLTAKLVGVFTPKMLGKRKLVAAFTYKEGKEIEIPTITEVIQVKLDIQLDEHSKLPDKVALNTQYEVAFLLSNNTALDASEISLADVEGLLDITLLKEKPDGQGGYEAIGKPMDRMTFNEQSPKAILDPGHRFRIKGTLKTNEAGESNLKLLVKYKETESLPSDHKDKAGARFEKTMTIVSITVRGEVIKGLLPKIKLGDSCEVIFNFINESTEFPATGIKINIEEKQEEV